MMDRNKTEVMINGRKYTLISDENNEYMSKLIDTLNKQIDDVKKKNSSLHGERPLVLAALNICDLYLKSENGGKILIESLQRRYDEVVEENKNLNEIINQSDFEIDIAILRAQVEELKKENEELKKKLKG